MDKIYSFPRKTITYEELFQLYKNLSYDELVEKIEELILKNILAPKIKSGTNGRNPSLYKKYSVNIPKEDFTGIEDEIKSLNAGLSISYYLNKPKEYKNDMEYILKLNDYMIYKSDKLKFPMSINERSYDIWGEEKFLRKSTSLISNLGLDYKKLNVYETPEPFFSKIVSKDSNNVLIVENKDTWFSLRRVLMEKNINILGLDVGILIYGEGKKIISSIDYIKDEDFDFLKAPSIYYWGDIDYEGINIIYSLMKKIDVKLFTKAYEEMLKNAKGVLSLGKMSAEQKKPKDLELFLVCFKEHYRDKIVEILENNRYIPQEIVNYKILMEE